MILPLDTTALSSVDDIEEIGNDDLWPNARNSSVAINKKFLAALLLEARPRFVRSSKRADFLVKTYFAAEKDTDGIPLCHWVDELITIQVMRATAEKYEHAAKGATPLDWHRKGDKSR